MSALDFEVFRFPSVGNAIADALGVTQAPECRLENGRTMLTFRRLGLSRWPEEQQMELALRAADTARAVLARDTRKKLRNVAGKAVVVIYEDALSVRGCAVVTRWECAVPGRQEWNSHEED